MLGPRAHRLPQSRNKAADTAAPSLGEPRSFAETSAQSGPAEEADARWPEAWARIAAEARVAAAPANDADPQVDPQKRALIVIPTLNEARAIAGVIERILDDVGLVDPLVVVADGGSTDGTREIVREVGRRNPRVRLIDNPGRFQSAGMNLAAAAIAGDRPWLVRVDAHAEYPRNYASTLIAEAQRTGATSVVVAMDTLGESGFQRAVAAAQNSLIGTGGSAHRLSGEGRWVDHGHHALFDLDVFETAGGYDETFSHNEDAELDLRLVRQGARIWLTDQVRIGYHPRATPLALWKQYLSYGRGRARTVLKHFTPLKLRQALPLSVAPAVASAPLGLVYWPFLVPALLWAVASLGFGAVLAARRRDPVVLMAGPAAMLMHLGWSAGFWAQLICHRGERSVHALLEPPRQAVS